MRHRSIQFAISFLFLAGLRLSAPVCMQAQDTLADKPPVQSAPEPPDDSPSDESTTLFPHFESDRIWLSGQANIITQWHPIFRSPYQGPNSLTPEAQDASSRVLTLLTGLRINDSSEILLDVQETGGHGIGEALGLAGFTNLDVVRNPTLSKAPYVARLMWHQIIPLSKEKAPSERTPLSLFKELPVRRLEIRFGKFSLVDFFDVNEYGSDSNFQFMNWTLDNNGAYDYAADTRGYTYAAMFEYDDRHWAFRFAEALMPKVANGINLDADLARAHSENVELELHHSFVPHRESVIRLLGYANHANMGIYSVAVANALPPQPPVITAHPLQTTLKYGFGVNLEQPLTDWLGLFSRWGWNEGQHESYAYTEDDETVQVGASANGTPWKRKLDRTGLAFISNGISRDHQQYLRLGGLGFVLGDGNLNYGRETIEEAYYTAHVWRGIFASFDLQHINNPGYNRDRGPVLAPALRLHVEL
ncbi:MAG TPA: carbohydrate porin [Candidatus Saccharimonadales bacterium]|nr:carbohydrate porin [Candidatus Saccharimonadales bacterium]